MSYRDGVSPGDWDDNSRGSADGGRVRHRTSNGSEGVSHHDWTRDSSWGHHGGCWNRMRLAYILGASHSVGYHDSAGTGCGLGNGLSARNKSGCANWASSRSTRGCFCDNTLWACDSSLNWGNGVGHNCSWRNTSV